MEWRFCRRSSMWVQCFWGYGTSSDCSAVWDVHKRSHHSQASGSFPTIITLRYSTNDSFRRWLFSGITVSVIFASSPFWRWLGFWIHCIWYSSHTLFTTILSSTMRIQWLFRTSFGTCFLCGFYLNSSWMFEQEHGSMSFHRGSSLSSYTHFLLRSQSPSSRYVKEAQLPRYRLLIIGFRICWRSSCTCESLLHYLHCPSNLCDLPGSWHIASVRVRSLS